MTFTHMNCHLFRGAKASSDTSSFVSLNPCTTPGSIVLAGASAVKQSIGSQVACRLSIEHFVEGILEYFGEGNSAEVGPLDFESEQLDAETSLRALESAFKRANRSVYSFGHSLAAGGRMAASFLGLVLEDQLIAAGRVGDGSAYLYRGEELFPFFEESVPVEGGDGTEGYLGTQSLVSVDLASVPVEAEDLILVLSQKLSEGEERSLESLLNRNNLEALADPATEIATQLFRESERVAFANLLCVGPEVIYLQDVMNQ